ncbi:MAG TPA: hypothetical protein HPP51_03095 [Planctomycetes bacterium]|nr:hypothetical protein [Planctomycetota bacterium]
MTAKNEIPILGKHKKRTVPDVVCPVCCKLMPDPAVIYNYDRYGRRLRRYFCWCWQCEQGFEVEQFDSDGRWQIHRYRRYVYDLQSQACVPKGGFVKLHELPEPPAVLTGPGGDYDEPVDPDEVKILEDISDILKNLAKALDLFAKGLKR